MLAQAAIDFIFLKFSSSEDDEDDEELDTAFFLYAILSLTYMIFLVSSSFLRIPPESLDSDDSDPDDDASSAFILFFKFK